jgi:predicted ArsR family transcriptional regulator
MSDGPGRKPTVSDGEILDIFRNSSDPILTAPEIAEHISISRRGILDRLKTLEADGTLESKKVGGRRTVWWYPGHTSTKSVESER